MEEKDIILKAEHISKQYRLGLVGTGTISHDLNRWWHKVRGKADPYLKVGESNDRSTKGQSEYVWALQDINFEVKRGEVLGIIGKNGAGKSTLLKILSKVTGPTTGEIKTKGRIASLLEVGTGFHGEMTGRENVYLNGAILGMTKKEIKSKIDEIIEFSGCQRYIDTPVKRYSSGMTVRLAFAVAAFLEPEILVIDEVLAVGDAEFQKKAIGKMQDISRGDGRTVIFVSHDMNAISMLTSRCVLLVNGKVKLTDTTPRVVSAYLNEYKEKLGLSEYVFFDKYKLVGFNLYKNEKTIDAIGFNESFDIKLELEQLKDSLELEIEVFIINGKGKVMTTFSTYLSGFKVSRDNNINLVCNVVGLNLSLGTYYLDLNVINMTNNSVKRLENIRKIEIISSKNYILKQKLKEQFHGNIIISHQWFQN
ncbi:ABC transporter ATP-binding protein [Algibacter lectus]|uniref:ABC transporter ATP-binding protein n=1 Tax=Algibacter lectus TaxID=221126 RepID=UPI0026EB26BD|nr:ABC transporter ATP-binding protein [Algibacter lectus]MDO7135388.1 ABC transporter ATP-binding protein [Algibacter lectus]